MREEFRTLVDLGPVSSDSDEADLMRFQLALEAITNVPCGNEAVALCGLFPDGQDDAFGLAWSLLHLIERSPDWPVWSALDSRNYWVTYLRESCERAGLTPAE